MTQKVKVGRNNPCPCGSGKKYKKCCLPLAEQLHRATGSGSTSIPWLDFAVGNKLDVAVAKAYHPSETVDLLTLKVSEIVLLRNLTEIVRSINLCLENKYFLSALKLIYAGIDNMAYLGTDTPQTSSLDFQKWADVYLLPKSGLDCTSAELWLARCGLLHQNTAGNRKLPPGTRYIFYSWGTSEPQQGPQHIDALKRGQCTFVGIESLRDALYGGIISFVGEISKEPFSRERLLLRSQKYFASLD